MIKRSRSVKLQNYINFHRKFVKNETYCFLLVNIFHLYIYFQFWISNDIPFKNLDHLSNDQMKNLFCYSERDIFLSFIFKFTHFSKTSNVHLNPSLCF